MGCMSFIYQQQTESWPLSQFLLSPGPLVSTPWQALFLAILLVASALWDAFTWGLIQGPLPGVAVEVDVR